MSSNVHTTLSRNDWHLDLVHDLPSQSLQGDPSIDDPVNDTDSALVRRFASKDVPAASVSCIENQSFVRGTLNPSKASLGNGTRNADFTRVDQCGAQGLGSASRNGEGRSPVAAGHLG